MSTASVESPPLTWPSTREPSWRDPLLVAALTSLSIILAAHFELSEALYAITRHAEYLQIDEWPVGMLVLLAGLVWLSWKRHRHAQHELQARRLAEATLASVVAENRQLARENLRIQEIERKHLARELHDELGQYLNAIKIDAVLILDSRGTESLEAATSIISAVDHLHGAVTQMISRLRPAALDELGLTAAIEHCIDHWRVRVPSTRFQLAVSGDCDNFGETLNLTVYRLIQEGLTNVFKHARASRVQVSLARTRMEPGGQDALHLTIADDGCGMQPGPPKSRFGVTGMRERVAMMSGRFTLDSAPGSGVRLEAMLPVAQDRR